MTTSSEFGQRIRLAREEAKLSQEALGKLLDPPRSHAAISDMERGVTRVGATDIAQLARILAKTTAFFYADETAPARPPSATFARGNVQSDLEKEFRREVDRELERRRKDKSA